MTLRQGDRVKFVLPLPQIFHDAEWNEHMELVFAGCDINLEMLLMIRNVTNANKKSTHYNVFTITSVDSDGDIRLAELPYTWPPGLFHKEGFYAKEKEKDRRV